MVEKAKLPVDNRKQGTVLASLLPDQEEFEKYVDWVGFVNFEPGEREKVLEELVLKGLVAKEGDEFKLTSEGEHFAKIIDMAFFKED